MLTRLPPRLMLARITLAWILALAATGIVLAVTQRFSLPWNLLALLASIWLVFSALGILRRWEERGTSMALFLRINVYALTFMILLVMGA